MPRIEPRDEGRMNRKEGDHGATYLITPSLFSIGGNMSTCSRAHALGAAGLLAALSLGRSAAAADRVDPNDVKALDASLGFERFSVKAYADAVAANVLSPAVAGVLARFGNEHASARDAIVAAFTQLGQTPSTTATVTLNPETFGSEAQILAYVYALERTIATAYLASVGPYKSRDLATLAASILGATTARVALLGEALNHGPAYPTGVVTP